MEAGGGGGGEEAEGMGESNSPPRAIPAGGGAAAPAGGGLSAAGMAAAVFEKLLADGNDEAVSNPDFKGLLDSHFMRLPHSYLLDVNVERAEEVLMHQKILAEARDPEKRPAFRVRFVKLENVKLELTSDSEEIEDGTEVADALSARHEVEYINIHEIIFSTTDKPKLLAQLSALLSDIGLNIREAHVFSTTDGYSLDVFVVDGWAVEDTDGLHKALEASIIRNEGSWSGSSHSSATERLLSLQPKNGGAEWEIDKRFLKMGDKIASGSCGDLHRGNYFGEEVAIKILRSEHLNENLWGEFIQEVNILREVQNKNVVRFIGACTKPPQYSIITEYMSGGNLYDYLHKKNNIMDLPKLVKFALDVCKGMEYLHQNGIIHRDLKSANLLMDKDHAIKVADFGVARFQNQGGVMTAETGTYRWMAPEVINHLPYDQKADIFSFAIVLWELVTSKIPYDTMTPLQAALGVRQGLRPIIPENTHPKLSELMQRCWDSSPSKRPSFSDLISELQELLDQIQERGESSQSSQGNDWQNSEKP
ncbi:hypothetical protein LUZ60_007476 [Juncus effusus]|nr:hypothetical protein LUZ60_007476 [Juncus effusus]